MQAVEAGLDDVERCFAATGSRRSAGPYGSQPHRLIGDVEHYILSRGPGRYTFGELLKGMGLDKEPAREPQVRRALTMSCKRFGLRKARVLHTIVFDPKTGSIVVERFAPSPSDMF